MASFKNILAGAVLSLLTACSTVRETNTERTATEQLLISHAVRAALAEVDLSPVDGRTVYLDAAHLKTVDQEFVVGELRARLLSAGAALVDTVDTAELVVEARSAALEIDQSKINIGVPAIPIPAVGILQALRAATFKERAAGWPVQPRAYSTRPHHGTAGFFLGAQTRARHQERLAFSGVSLLPKS